MIDFTGASSLRIPTWKLPAVKRFTAERAIAWIDDDLGPDAHEWAQNRTEPSLLLDIDPATGLVDGHVELLIEFADRVSVRP